MELIKLTTLSDKSVIFNWSNVIYMLETQDSFGNDYSEIQVVGGKFTQVKESLHEIENKLN